MIRIFFCRLKWSSRRLRLVLGRRGLITPSAGSQKVRRFPIYDSALSARYLCVPPPPPPAGVDPVAHYFAACEAPAAAFLIWKRLQVLYSDAAAAAATGAWQILTHKTHHEIGDSTHTHRRREWIRVRDTNRRWDERRKNAFVCGGGEMALAANDACCALGSHFHITKEMTSS